MVTHDNNTSFIVTDLRKEKKKKTISETPMVSSILYKTN